MTEVERICLAALDRPAEERAAFLEDACHGDEALRRDIESLLAHASPAEQFMEQPAVAGAGALAGLSGLSLGQRLGPYHIVARLGAGGMGEVYRAHDTQLGREVAVKILPVIFAADPERLARFEREARVLASLNHPHIAAIYGLERSNGQTALVMELIEGPTLAERMQRGPLSMAEALPVARQIAEALEAAHEQGIVHRDLKPANVKVRPDGAVKVLDFGLAKEIEPAGAAVNASLPPTIATPAMTQAGVILGTAAYMSPEQARGEPVDKRTDIWAFGCVLYEMLAGRAGFSGKTPVEVLAAVLSTEPDWSALRPDTPAAVQSLIRHCLQKDPGRRLRDIGDAHFHMEDALDERVGPGAGARTPARVRTTRVGLLALATLVVGLAMGVAAVWSQRTGRSDEVRLDINAPPTVEPASLNISPDGTMVVFVASSDGRSRLWVRSLDGKVMRSLPGTEGARYPFWKPDGRAIGFSADAQLKRVDVDSGSVRLVVSGGAIAGAWSQDGTILYDQGPGSPLFRVSEEGGTPVPATTKSLEADDHWFPQLLPDYRHVLFYATGTIPGIYIAEMGSADAPRWILDAQAATYAASGHLLFVREGSLLAQRFDLATLELSGRVAVIANGIMAGEGAGTAALSASAAGPIVYRSGPSAAQHHFGWFDRAGKLLETVAGSDIGAGYSASLSRDGSRLATSRRTSGNSDIWLVDLRRGVPSIFTSAPSVEITPVWSPDGRRIAFASSRRPENLFDLYVKASGGSGNEETEELLVGTEGSQDIPSDWSSDGRFILYTRSRQKAGFDIWALSVGDRKTFRVVETASSETNGQFSPDGRWIAYQSNASGRFEVYLQPFMRGGSPLPVSGGGGVQVRWRRDGGELFYLAPDKRLMAVKTKLDAHSENEIVGTPVSLFTSEVAGEWRDGHGRHYMPSDDGQRFLIDTLKEVTLPITVLLNWTPEP